MHPHKEPVGPCMQPTVSTFQLHMPPNNRAFAKLRGTLRRYNRAYHAL